MDIFFSKFREYIIHNPVENKVLYKKYFLFLILIIIVLWQSSFYFFKTEVSSKYRRADATGFNHWWGQNFVYYYIII